MSDSIIHNKTVPEIKSATAESGGTISFICDCGQKHIIVIRPEGISK